MPHTQDIIIGVLSSEDGIFQRKTALSRSGLSLGKRMGPWLPGWRQWSCQPPKSWIFMDAVIVISVNDKGKWIGKGIVTCREWKRWLLEGDGCVATTEVHWVALGAPFPISIVNGQEWQLRFVRPVSWSHYLLLRWTTEISGDTGWGWVGSTIVRRGGWRWASSVEPEASHSTGGYGFLQKSGPEELLSGCTCNCGSQKYPEWLRWI